MQQAKFDEAVAYAEEIKELKESNRIEQLREDLTNFNMIFQAARAMLDDSQGEDMRVSNAEGYLQHVQDDLNNLPSEYEMIEHFSNLILTLYNQE